MSETTVIHGERVDLRELTLEEAAAVLEPGAARAEWAPDWPVDGSRAAAGAFTRQAADDRVPGFGMYAVVRTDDGTVVGDMGFHGRPSDGVVEIGFSLAPSARGMGYASEALALLTAWADAQLGVSRIIARTTTSNVRSQTVLMRAGFLADVGRPGVEGDDVLHLVWAPPPPHLRRERGLG